MKERGKKDPNEVDVSDIMDYIDDDKRMYKLMALAGVIISSIVLLVFSIIFFKDYIF